MSANSGRDFFSTPNISLIHTHFACLKFPELTEFPLKLDTSTFPNRFLKSPISTSPQQRHLSIKSIEDLLPFIGHTYLVFYHLTKREKSLVKAFPVAYRRLSPTERADFSDFLLQTLFELTFLLPVVDREVK